MNFSESVTKFIERHQLIRPGARLLLGVSGGTDSMALLHFLITKKKAWDLELAVCSVDHMLRGAQSAADLAFVASFCHRQAIPFIGKKVDARARSVAKKISIETAARELRYEAFADALKAWRADALVLAHHGDDQVETMLMRQVRGTAGPARAGIPVRRAFAGREIIRPFLSLTKTDLEAYCRENGIAAREDETNASEAHTRNRFRKYVLPFLKQENPLVHLKFQYESEYISEDEALLGQLAESCLDQVLLQKNEQEYLFSVPALKRVHPALQRRVIHLILCYLYTSRQSQPRHRPIHIEQILHVLRSVRASGRLFLPDGVIAVKSYNRLRVGFIRECGDTGGRRMLAVPGETMVAAGTVRAAYRQTVPMPQQDEKDVLILDAAAARLPLYVRTWRNGDRMHPNGMSGSQKIQRIFIDRKIDRFQRRIWPVITDATGRILWLPLLKRAVPFPASSCSDTKGRNYLQLEFLPFSGFGRIWDEGRY